VPTNGIFVGRQKHHNQRHMREDISWSALGDGTLQLKKAIAKPNC